MILSIFTGLKWLIVQKLFVFYKNKHKPGNKTTEVKRKIVC